MDMPRHFHVVFDVHVLDLNLSSDQTATADQLNACAAPKTSACSLDELLFYPETSLIQNYVCHSFFIRAVWSENCVIQAGS
jgi:hypothetical protein